VRHGSSVSSYAVPTAEPPRWSPRGFGMVASQQTPTPRVASNRDCRWRYRWFRGWLRAACGMLSAVPEGVNAGVGALYRLDNASGVARPYRRAVRFVEREGLMSVQQPNKGRNVVVGCLVALAIVVVGGAAVAYFLVGRPALAAISAA